MDNVIAWLRRNADSVSWVCDSSFMGRYLGHQIRYNTTDRELDVGYLDFDRWANSCAHSVVVTGNGIANQVNCAIQAARDNRETPPWHYTLQAIHAIFGN